MSSAEELQFDPTQIIPRAKASAKVPPSVDVKMIDESEELRTDAISNSRRGKK